MRLVRRRSSARRGLERAGPDGAAGHNERMQVWPGNPYPLGAAYDGTGTNFAVFSEIAEHVEVCLFGTDGAERRIQMTERTGFVWHCFVPGVQPGVRYGFRVFGPYDPAHGHRCNPNKLLLDPYARQVEDR